MTKRTLGAVLLTLLVALGATAQEANRIVGIYLTEKKNAKIKIERQGENFIGTLIWSITPRATDKNNPDEGERTKPLVGKRILSGFVYDGDNEWNKGKVYDPESGKTYSCKITRQKDGSLKVRGFIGVSLLGRTSVWTPVKD